MYVWGVAVMIGGTGFGEVGGYHIEKKRVKNPYPVTATHANDPLDPHVVINTHAVIITMLGPSRRNKVLDSSRCDRTHLLSRCVPASSMPGSKGWRRALESTLTQS